MVWHPDHCGAGQSRRHGSAGVRLLRRRPRAVPVLKGRACQRGFADSDRRRGDLPADTGIRHRHRRQVRPPRARRRSRRIVRLRRTALRSPRLRSSRLRGVQHLLRPSGRGRISRGHRAPGEPAAPPGSDYPGRTAPYYRGARHRGWPVRGRGGDPGLLGTTRRKASAAADRCVHGHRPQRAGASARPVRAPPRNLPSPGARRRRHLLLPRNPDHQDNARPPLHRSKRARSPSG
ncbi:Uncharacterised protein [Mycobacteroides abscessus subsp. abscessus]|nr:Uncharacterised protein [Mycobacteroides abscessus subsp. abscessus]